MLDRNPVWGGLCLAAEGAATLAGREPVEAGAGADGYAWRAVGMKVEKPGKASLSGGCLVQKIELIEMATFNPTPNTSVHASCFLKRHAAQRFSISAIVTITYDAQ